MLDVFLVLAFVSTIGVTVISQQPVGPEGPIGVWFLLLIPCLLTAITVFLLVAKGSLNLLPGGRLVQFAIALGILVTFSTAISATLSRYDNLIRGLLIAIPFLILACCAAKIHHTHIPYPRIGHWMAMIVLGGAALVGWGLAGWGVILYVKNDIERSSRQAQRESEQEDQREQWEVSEYAKLDNSATLYTLLQFTWARNQQVRQQARERAGHYPELDERLIELLDRDCEEAISYIAKLYENPPAKLAPAWGRMLERQLKKWDSLQYDEYAGTWEQNLINYFKGAQKIQRAGGSLHPELSAWHEHLLKCKGLGNLAAFVKNLL
jgi:hypothetical protein